MFEDRPIPLQKWLPALWLLTNCKNGISSYELALALGATRRTAWFMLSRLRLVLQDEQRNGCQKALARPMSSTTTGKRRVAPRPRPEEETTELRRA